MRWGISRLALDQVQKQRTACFSAGDPNCLALTVEKHSDIFHRLNNNVSDGVRNAGKWSSLVVECATLNGVYGPHESCAYLGLHPIDMVWPQGMTNVLTGGFSCDDTDIAK